MMRRPLYSTDSAHYSCRPRHSMRAWHISKVVIGNGFWKINANRFQETLAKQEFGL